MKLINMCLFGLLICSVQVNACNSKQIIQTECRLDKHGVGEFIWKITSECDLDSVIVYRSYVDFSKMKIIDLYYYPVTKTVIVNPDLTDTLYDSLLTDNCTYYYYIKAFVNDGSELYGAVKLLECPDITLPAKLNGKMEIYIDKKAYLLSLAIDSCIIKKYPICLGGDPFTRKLHYDCLTTPQGKYQVSCIKMKSDFYKSIGVSYPNSDDKKRYQQALRNGEIPRIKGKVADIGGSIFIHGGGIFNNWTWGCIAMRNSDIDEIINLPLLKIGTPIYIK